MVWHLVVLPLRVVVGFLSCKYMNGYIKLHRKLLENPLMKKPTWAWLWVVLLLKTNHEDNTFIFNGETITIKRGQFLTGRKQLSRDSGIPETTIEDILNFLESQQQIRQQKCNKHRIITIIKWGEYQSKEKDYNNSDNKATTKRQQSDTNKNDKNDKNINNSDKSPISKKDLLKSMDIKQVNTQQWQLDACELIESMNVPEDKKSSIFKCFKDNPRNAKFALSDCRELDKMNINYFFKIFNELNKR